MATREYELQDILDSYSLDEVKIRGKARALLDDRMDEVYRRLSDNDLPTGAFMEILKFLAEIGDMKPKKDTGPVQQGPGFSITINVPQPGGDPITIRGATIDITPDSSEPGLLDETEDLLPALEGAAPVNFNTLDFQFNHDLSANIGAFDDGDYE